MSLSPASGIGKYAYRSAKTIRFVRKGCTNRPFYHIVATERMKGQHQPVIEQLGTYDPMENEYNEKLVSLNLERVKFWLARGALMSKPAAELLGLSGFLPIHPITYMRAWRNRRAAENNQEPEVMSTKE